MARRSPTRTPDHPAAEAPNAAVLASAGCRASTASGAPTAKDLL
jgi:hypothetical protein